MVAAAAAAAAAVVVVVVAVAAVAGVVVAAAAGGGGRVGRSWMCARRDWLHGRPVVMFGNKVVPQSEGFDSRSSSSWFDVVSL